MSLTLSKTKFNKKHPYLKFTSDMLYEWFSYYRTRMYDEYYSHLDDYIQDREEFNKDFKFWKEQGQTWHTFYKEIIMYPDGTLEVFNEWLFQKKLHWLLK